MTKQELLTKTESMINQGDYKINKSRSHEIINVINYRLILDDNIYIGFHYHTDWKEYEINYIVCVKDKVLTEFVPFCQLDDESKSKVDIAVGDYLI